MAEPPRDTVAIVDDDQGVRHSLSFLLEIVGHKVETFASAGDFLKAVDLHNFACLILDQHMPGLTGLELAEKLRADGHLIPIMLTTGLPSVAISARAAELGIDRVVEKPPDEEGLLAFIDAAIRRG